MSKFVKFDLKGGSEIKWRLGNKYLKPHMMAMLANDTSADAGLGLRLGEHYTIEVSNKVDAGFKSVPFEGQPLTVPKLNTAAYVVCEKFGEISKMKICAYTCSRLTMHEFKYGVLLHELLHTPPAGEAINLKSSCGFVTVDGTEKL